MKIRRKRKGQQAILLLKKKYQIIYADPPWSYQDMKLPGNRSINCKYQVQSKDWIDNCWGNEI